jgi:hypothetical protein
MELITNHCEVASRFRCRDSRRYIISVNFVLETGPKDLLVVIGFPGGSSPRPPFSRFARRAVVDRAPSLLCS